MALFTSARERRLWIWALSVVALIYSTLPLAGTMAGVLRESGVLTLVFVVAMLLVVATVVTHGLQSRPSGAEIGVGFGLAAIYLMVFVRMTIPEERTHLIEYGVVGVFIYQALTERARQGGRAPAAVIAVVVTTLIGALDECIQAVLPSRVFDPRDILFNAFAGAMAIGATHALTHTRRPGA